MRYMSVVSVKPENYTEAIDRWKKGKAAGTKTPGMQTIGTWFDGADKAFALIETDDPVVTARVFHEWADAVERDVVPVVDADGFLKALGD
jgi:hypothetical protein